MPEAPTLKYQAQSSDKPVRYEPANQSPRAEAEHGHVFASSKDGLMAVREAFHALAVRLKSCSQTACHKKNVLSAGETSQETATVERLLQRTQRPYRALSPMAIVVDRGTRVDVGEGIILEMKHRGYRRANRSCRRGMVLYYELNCAILSCYFICLSWACIVPDG